MTPERWREIEAVFEEARNLNPSERATFLDRACASDQTLRQEVESLLAADEGATGFLERPPAFPAEADEKTTSDDRAREARLIELFSAELTGRYRLERVLGRGGMATVYLAQDIRHDRPVAFKVLRWELGRLLGRDRFQQEVRMAARLSHPHILPVHDSGETAGQLWFTMPFVDGDSLRDRLDREIQLPIADAFRIASEAAGALEYAHQHGVIHRDVKPENLLLTKDGNTVVADFGIARPVKAEDDVGRFTEPGVTVGTPAYMSPEQANGERVLDARTDVYSLGCVLYEMLAGEPPFTGPTAQALNAKRLTGEIPSVRRVRSAVPAAVEQVLMRTLAPVPGDRFPTAAAFAEALATAQHDPAAVTAPRPEHAKPSKRSKPQILLLAASLALATVAAVIAARLSHTHTDPAGPFISRPLTFAGNAEQPVLSPDGRKMAYVQIECEAGKNNNCPVTLRVQEIGSEQSVVLATATWVVWPQWAPDGTSLLVRLMDNGHLATYVVPLSGDAPREIGSFGFTGFSLTGDTVVIVDRVLHGGSAVVRHVRSSTGELLDSINIPLPLTNLANFIQSPDGRWLVFAGQNRHGSELLLTAPDGRVTDSVAVAPLETLRWNKQGDAVYTFSGGVGLNNWLLRIGIDSKRGRFAHQVDTLLSLPTLGGEFDIAPDGRSLVYAGGPVTTTVWALDLTEKGAPPRRLTMSTSRIGAPTLSSDGQLIAYGATDQTGDNIYVIPFQGGKTQRVTYDSVGYGGTQWFPNGHRLMYQRWGPKLEAFGQGFPGGRRELVARVEGGQGLLALPDSGVVVQVAANHLIILKPDGAKIKDIVLPDSLGEDVSLWGADADRQSIYVRAISLAPYRPRLFKVDRASGDLTLMGDLPIAKMPMPLGGRGSVLYAVWEGVVHTGHPTIWRLSAGRPAVRVRELPLECDPSTLSMSLDEQRFVCTASVSTKDIFLVEHIDTFRR